MKEFVARKIERACPRGSVSMEDCLWRTCPREGVSPGILILLGLFPTWPLAQVTWDLFHTETVTSTLDADALDGLVGVFRGHPSEPC